MRAAAELLERASQPAARSSEPLDEACKRLLALVRRNCPDLLPREPLEPGRTAPPIPVPPKDAGRLVTIAARQAALEAAGVAVPADVERLPAAVLWQEGPDALLVEVGAIEVRVGDGVIAVAIPVRCDQLPRGRDLVQVDLVFGTPARPAGLLAAATEPRGPRVVVRRWSDALTALAWQAVLDTIGGVAAAAGVDRDGTALIPAALTVGPGGLAILAQARHAIDRLRPGRVVSTPFGTGTRRP